MRFVLASASPRRAELLSAAGFEFDVHVADVDERMQAGEPADAYVRRMSEAKARAVAARLPDRLVLGADTIVVVGAETLGKPADQVDARRMLRMLSNRRHDVLTAVTLAGPAGTAGAGERMAVTRVDRTAVEFSPLSEAELDWYIHSAEPIDKAGAYAIQGLASRFVRRIEGSYTNVVGLPVALVYQMLHHAH